MNWLTRPLIALDVETHAKTQPEQARIVELGFIVIYPNPEKKPLRWCKLLNPGCPIDPEATAVHHITDEDVKDAPKFEEIATNLVKGFSNCDYCGYNVSFDLRVLSGEMGRAKVVWSYVDAHIFDPLRLWQIVEPRHLGDAVTRFLGREQTDAHRAIGDAEDALEVGTKMLELYPTKLPQDMKRLHELCFKRDPLWIDQQGKIVWRGEDACLSFGKHANVPLRLVPKQYLEWIATSDFPVDTKQIIGDMLFGKFPTKQSA